MINKTKNVEKEKIDLVYCWCDGLDPEWKERRQRRLDSLNMVYEPDSDENGDCRYEQLDEIRYSLRSVGENLPWVNHIYLVTDNQRPEWLKENPKIIIVDHKEIIPEYLLPTFNSVTIEMYIDRIPRLSEKFIYGNDDFFFNKRLSPEDFFKDDIPITWLEEYPIFSERLSKSEGKRILSGRKVNNWGMTVLRAWILFLEKNNIDEKQMPFYGPVHSFSAYTKNIFREVKEKYPEILKINAQPFRTNNEIMRIIFQFEGIWSYGSELHINPRRARWLRLRSHVWKTDMFNIYQETVDCLERELEVYKPKAFCLNNIKKEEKNKMISFLDRKFPKKFSWEK